MKKILKFSIIFVCVLIIFVLLDTLQAGILKNSPLISWKETLGGIDSWVDRGILIDTYHCKKEDDIVTVSWEFKKSKFACPIDNDTKASEEKLNAINDLIIAYFEDNNENTFNLSSNYVDFEENVVVVELLYNTKGDQELFNELVVHSKYIKFIQGGPYTNHDY